VGKDEVAIFKNLPDCTFPAGSDGGMERQRGTAIMCSDNVQFLSGAHTKLSPLTLVPGEGANGVDSVEFVLYGGALSTYIRHSAWLL
jgi:hypothetical protein